MPGIWLKVTHHPQHHPSDCLAACAFMVLDYLHRPQPYEKLFGLLGISPYLGAPASKVKNLAGLVSEVIYASHTWAPPHRKSRIWPAWFPK
jgi:hypothetical protein